MCEAAQRVERRLCALRRFLEPEPPVLARQRCAPDSPPCSRAGGGVHMAATSAASTTTSEVALVVGAGDGIGAAVARRFARAGYTVCVARRNKGKLDGLISEVKSNGGDIHGFALDARKEDQVVALVRHIEEDIGLLAVCVFNIGANVKFPLIDTTSRVYFKVWEMACFAAFLVGREAARVMTPRRKGSIIFTGATASTRGAAGFAAFSGALAAKRSLAQSMARELGPKGIHVAHIVVDGPVDGEFVRSLLPESVLEEHTVDVPRLLSPAHVAEMFYVLHSQPRRDEPHQKQQSN